MCLTIPGKIVKVNEGYAIADFGGKERKINTDFLNVELGDYVLCVNGFAAEKIPKKKALKILKAFYGNKG